MQANWKASGWVREILCLLSADTMEGRGISTAWPIIWSNGGPSARDKRPRLFCISSSDDWLTFVPRRWSQLKAPSVKPATAAWRRASVGNTHTVAHSPLYCHVCAFLSLFYFLLSFLSLVSFFFSPFSFCHSHHARLLKAISSFLCCHALRSQFPIVWLQV